MGYIYKIINSVNGKIYIGQTTKSIEDRFAQHIKKAKAHINRYLYDAMNHYGYENFCIEEVEQCRKELLDNREKYWIEHYQANDSKYGYNMTSGGGGGDTWTANPHKEDTIRKSKETKIRNGTIHNGGCYGPSPKKGIYKVEIDRNQLYNMLIDKNITLKQICEYFHCSRSTIRKRTFAYFGKSLEDINISQARNKYASEVDEFVLQKCINEHYLKIEAMKVLNVTEHMLDQCCIKKYGQRYTLAAECKHKNNFKYIPESILRNLLSDTSLTKKGICEVLHISRQTLETKCVELFGKSVDEFRGISGRKHRESTKLKLSQINRGKSNAERYGQDVADKMRRISSEKWKGEKNPNYKNVNQDGLLNMILANCMIKDIAQCFNVSRQTIYYKCGQYFGTRKPEEIRKIWTEN